MHYGLYTAFLGMRARQRTLESQAHNIANASTAGFKAERLIYSLIEKKSSAGGPETGQNLVAGVSSASGTDFTAGATRQTGRSLDLSIEGDAFLQIQTPRGVRFTRAGNLTIDSAGQLVTKAGDLVVGQRGPITIPKGAQLKIGRDAALSVGDNQFDRLRLVRFDQPAGALKKEGEALFMLTGAEEPQEDTRSRVVQGALESSNIDPVSEMVAMISNNREFESLQRSLSLIMNDVGRKISSDIGNI